MGAVISEWERCKPWIEAALERSDGTHTIEDIERGLAERKLMLAANERAAIIFEIINHPQKRSFHIFLGGGELGEIHGMFAQFVTDLARAYECNRITISGREGWARALRDYGYRQTSVVLSKDI